MRLTAGAWRSHYITQFALIWKRNAVRFWNFTSCCAKFAFFCFSSSYCGRFFNFLVKYIFFRIQNIIFKSNCIWFSEYVYKLNFFCCVNKINSEWGAKKLNYYLYPQNLNLNVLRWFFKWRFHVFDFVLEFNNVNLSVFLSEYTDLQRFE